jgi:hypothetical protein
MRLSLGLRSLDNICPISSELLFCIGGEAIVQCLYTELSTKFVDYFDTFLLIKVY